MKLVARGARCRRGALAQFNAGGDVAGTVTHKLSLRSTRAGYCCGIAAVLAFFGSQSLQNATAEGETRTISFHHMHTDEDLTVTYKVNGRYDESALEKINHVLRDWREEQPIKMDPHLIDLLWEVHREVGSKEPIWVVCGYRSPSTNSMLRHRSSGVAKFSQHMLGKAIDFYIPGVPLDQLRAAGLRAQRGGVGFYPTSGSPFVHLDTGSVRHWPRMPEAELASVLSKGQLASHVASDSGRQQSRKPSLLARLFGGGKDEEEDAQTAAAPAPAKVAAARLIPSPPAAKPAVIVAQGGSNERTVPLPTARPARPETYRVASAAAILPGPPAAPPADSFALASAATSPAPAAGGYGLASATSQPVRLAQAASLVAQADGSANAVINDRGYWQGLPSADAPDSPPVAAARPAPAPRRPAAVAGAEPATTASVAPSWPLTERSDSEPPPSALAYAAQPTPIAAARAIPMGTGTPRTPPAETTVAVKHSDEPPPVTPSKTKGTSVVRIGDRFNDPWMRAMIVSPSAQTFMRTTLYGVQDYRNLRPHMQKPAAAVMMRFSEDPYLGMASDRFAGSAVVFTPTVAFRTAALK